ncbi:conserved protein of unknown function [Limnospira indica PCC 8005]|uniref:Uncharacterized protein n=1 Tax=Limnospira indica PCC 8005 TaxID=376219 RepID=A0A9P1KFD2_9CYAN|nr:conserved protein of unknown function [Limnospira indica PCC 8005]
MMWLGLDFVFDHQHFDTVRAGISHYSLKNKRGLKPASRPNPPLKDEGLRASRVIFVRSIAKILVKIS